jgi:dTDP-4-dehydrorhamnose reductase
MKILVTGANGLLGQKLTRLLAGDRRVELIATARKPLVSPVEGTFARLDITRKKEVDDVVGTARPEVIINAAAMTQVDQCETERTTCWQNNVEGVAHLVDACREYGSRLLHLSTDFIFDGTHGPLDESETPNPLSYYGASKLAAEELIQKSALPWTILRTVLVYGVTPDMSRSNIVLWVKKSLENHQAIRVVDDQWRTPTLAEDLAQGCSLAALQNATGIYHLSGDEMMTPYTLATRTAAFFGLDSSLITKTDSTQFKQPAVRPLKTGFIIEKARRELGYRPHSFNAGLAIVKEQLDRSQG